MSIKDEIKKYHDIILTAGSQAVSELIGIDSFFEIGDISFNFAYNDETGTDEFVLLYLNCSFGKTEDINSQYSKEFVLYSIPVYKLDNLDFLYGFFFGAISKYVED